MNRFSAKILVYLIGTFSGRALDADHYHAVPLLARSFRSKEGNSQGPTPTEAFANDDRDLEGDFDIMSGIGASTQIVGGQTKSLPFRERGNIWGLDNSGENYGR